MKFQYWKSGSRRPLFSGISVKISYINGTYIGVIYTDRIGRQEHFVPNLSKNPTSLQWECNHLKYFSRAVISFQLKDFFWNISLWQLWILQPLSGWFLSKKKEAWVESTFKKRSVVVRFSQLIGGYYTPFYVFSIY